MYICIIKLHSLPELAEVNCGFEGTIRSNSTAIFSSNFTLKLVDMSAELGASVAAGLAGTTGAVLCDGTHISACVGAAMASVATPTQTNT